MEEGAHHGVLPELGPTGGGADLISALPGDLLLQVLARLRCARAAARTSLLSRRWRRLTGFTFRDLALCSLQPALDSLVHVPDVFLLDIHCEVPPPVPRYELTTRRTQVVHLGTYGGEGSVAVPLFQGSCWDWPLGPCHGEVRDGEQCPVPVDGLSSLI